jgi:hypothetical protein
VDCAETVEDSDLDLSPAVRGVLSVSTVGIAKRLFGPCPVKGSAQDLMIRYVANACMLPREAVD